MSDTGDRDSDVDFQADAELLAELVAPVLPSSPLRDGLLAAIAGPWWAPFARRAGRLLDLDADATIALFRRIDDDGAYEPGPSEGVDLFHIDAGPALAGAITGFVRLEAGARFPHHRHVGHESVLVLQGSFVDSDGRAVAAGQETLMDPDSAHTLVAGEGGCLYLAVVHEGLAFDGEDPIGPDDPRA